MQEILMKMKDLNNTGYKRIKTFKREKKKSIKNHYKEIEIYNNIISSKQNRNKKRERRNLFQKQKTKEII